MECPSCQTAVFAGQRTCPGCGLRVEGFEGTDPLSGMVLDGRYQLLEKVGSGGMGSVYRAVQLAVGREVAVKVVNVLALQDPATLRRFQTEARIISQLRHPNTLTLIDFGNMPDERPYLVTEFLRGESLSQALARGPMSPRRTLEILYEICDALTEAHAQGIIHRDLKPENIFLEAAEGRTVVRVLDFGIAKLGQTNNTATGTVCGTPAYMSPEQAQGGVAEPRSDVYALGILAYRCMVGRAPFEGEQPLAVLLKQIQEQPLPLRQAMMRPDLPTEVEWLVMAMLEKEPERRPGSAADVRAHIEHILTQVSLPLMVPSAPGISVPIPVPQAVLTPAHTTPVPFVSEAGLGSDPAMMRVLGVGLIALAVSIAAGAFLWKQGEADRVPVVQAVTAPVPMEVEEDEVALPAAPDLPPLEEAPDAIVDGPAKGARAEVRAKARRSGGAPTVSASEKKASEKKDGEKTSEKKKKKTEPPPGFLDFDVN
ncbi:MAG: serine/threonine protein kinase [Myxococcales bacterium]|nr:serine/threonine protein kinase [Myxococcales bacterium]